MDISMDIMLARLLINAADHHLVLNWLGPIWKICTWASRQRKQMYRVFQKTDTQFYFWDNFGNSAPILIILSLLQAEIYGA